MQFYLGLYLVRTNMSEKGNVLQKKYPARQMET